MTVNTEIIPAGPVVEDEPTFPYMATSVRTGAVFYVYGISNWDERCRDCLRLEVGGKAVLHATNLVPFYGDVTIRTTKPS